MKVQLIVVQGKPEGKVIPLAGPIFKIGRGETCHLRPNSEQVSREHAEFSVTADKVVLRDLGSRNGTLVNGKALTEPYTLKDRDLVQIGQLTFAISIEDVPTAAAPIAVAPAKTHPKAASPDDVSHDEIESWLVADNNNPPPERPSGVYGGETITITAFKDGASPKPIPPAPSKPAPPAAAAAPAPAPVAAAPTPAAKAPVAAPTPAAKAPVAAPTPAPKAPVAAPTPAKAPTPPPVPAAATNDLDDVEYERLPEGLGDVDEFADGDETSDDDAESSEEELVDEYVDESNPFYVKKAKEPEAPAKQSYKDTSDAASEILRKLMDKRRSSK
ncbi:FHA domain-containing protein [Singulisphaera acidiphila]|uniref:FHA domain-containing protein n=1 Tax=Singulisphaera acidiphila (strain ATCC BAA-1392 / DSM 18658 / VKM B-2454 / MOB10) TaxID=886293 RepID=L0DJN7_SINAD|nr:FHA domain-containing protein [Singulisphaera acidiphila]AGA29467.1 FHA domain-containing protein [Singulisphaera acidiphila DSM 18658]